MIEKLYHIFKSSTGVNTDTRSLKEGNLFFALSGKNFDGNEYIQKALEKGALHAVSSDPRWKDDKRVSVVTDVLECLQKLATYHRLELNIPIIGLTGSNGKTTTKELILSVLSTQFKVSGTKGNLNNHIGVPLTLLSFDDTIEIGVVEMGANHPNEIKTLSSIARPNFGLITNYGKAHLEGFGSIEGVKTSKSELYDYLKSSDGTVIVGRWDPEQIVRSSKIKQVFTPENTFIFSETPYLTFIVNNQLIKSNLTGVYNYHNALFAYTVGELLNVQPNNIVSGIENYIPKNNRSQILQRENTRIILDAYNANPSSMKVALENLASQKEKHKVAILGDMFELGEYAVQEHQNICDLAEKLKIKDIFLIGENFQNTLNTRAVKYKTRKEFNNAYSMNTDKEQVILIKGSRGMGLEEILKTN
ncbi:UDP-N-acetylmuramoyl-tripeptide--D-alanyl-D-alanine ligase [Nonlabens dokdonensis]|uniref:UDP-N-acetylmuramoyl-tripeptide--D-alanyl-D-alanine ligase n=2 Tax=Nonlabens dokdonensis TaxID=328515 RepID=L7WA95_NONDD|nr:UDP-N-acetylmuramoyl-tripeptide--D-alanyl-D-alanine ligase [Nonlabens dokdonensis]AGC77137.1 UDP-N-acetylmuramoyl-tripeptide--D-alanyl-D-alanine ligase [Nonlabens dokdonensis DSW-6]PZX41096.1 UDP-N-acetylmuramoyl-tripeptide--D-alanyl-D-alanine ligase [Nonlabens dokdonensis]